jgi:hypothetical protein
LWAAQTAPPSSGSDAAMGRGLRWLERLTDMQVRHAEVVEKLRYPLFTASYAAQVFANVGDGRRAAMWADVIERFRINEKLGWPTDHPACGAWGDASVPPLYAKPVPDLLAPNISETALAVQARLLSAARTSDHPPPSSTMVGSSSPLMIRFATKPA